MIYHDVVSRVNRAYDLFRSMKDRKPNVLKVSNRAYDELIAYCGIDASMPIKDFEALGCPVVLIDSDNDGYDLYFDD